MSRKQRLDAKIPWWINCAVTSAYGYYRRRRRWSGNYAKWFSFFQEREFWSLGDLQALQEETLRQLIGYVYHHVPYYRKVMDQRMLQPADFSTLADLPKLPILTKVQVSQHTGELFCDEISASQLICQTTGGSTGSPLKLYRSPELEQIQDGFVWARFRRHVCHSDPSASFTGRDLHLGVSRSRPPYWVDNWADRQRLFSVFYLGLHTMPDYFRALQSYPCRFITGYQSAWGLLANYAIEQGMSLATPIEHYYSSSEELQPHNVAAIERAFGCKVWNHYGQGEHVGAITEYDCGHLHYDMDYSILEFLPVGLQDGLTLAKVIGTRLHDRTWPLIRYDTGDLILYDPTQICRARHSPVIRQIFGRTGSYIDLPDGRRINNITTIAKRCRNFRQIQAVQTNDGSLVLRVVPTAAFSQNEQTHMLNEFRKTLGSDIPIEILLVDEVEKTRSGKALSIINQKRSS